MSTASVRASTHPVRAIESTAQTETKRRRCRWRPECLTRTAITGRDKKLKHQKRISPKDQKGRPASYMVRVRENHGTQKWRTAGHLERHSRGGTVGHPSRRWEPETSKFIGGRGLEPCCPVVHWDESTSLAEVVLDGLL